MLIKQLKDSIEKGAAESTVPQELLDVFNNELPDGIEYKCFDSEHLVIDFSKTENTITVLQSDNSAFYDKYNKYFKSGEDILKIARMTQTPLTVHSKKTLYEGKEIDQKYVFRNIFNNDVVNPVGVLESPSLPKICLKLSDSQDESISADVHLQMQRCDNVERCTYSNSDQDEVTCVNMEIDTEYANVELYNVSLHLFIDIKKAKRVKEIVNAYKLYEALINNRLLINDKPFIYTNDVDEDKFKGVQLGLDLYKKLEILEKVLNVQFIPLIETKVEELYYVNWLYSSLVEKKPFIEKATINNIVATKSENKDLIKEKSKGQLFAFCLNGKLELTIFGQDITVYYIRIHSKLKIKGFEPIDNEEVKILFDDDENKNQAVYMLYRTKQELDDVVSDDNFIGKIMSLDKNDYTTF